MMEFETHPTTPCLIPAIIFSILLLGQPIFHPINSEDISEDISNTQHHETVGPWTFSKPKDWSFPPSQQSINHHSPLINQKARRRLADSGHWVPCCCCCSSCSCCCCCFSLAFVLLLVSLYVFTICELFVLPVFFVLLALFGGFLAVHGWN